MSILRIVAILALLCAGTLVDDARAQEIDFGQINKFESLGTGTLQVGAPPKTIIDDGIDTSSFSPSGMLMPRPKFTGNRQTEARPEPRSYPEKAFRPFKPLENSDSRPSASQIGVSNMDTCCSA